MTAFDGVGPDVTLSYSALERWMSANGLDDRICCRVTLLLGMQAAMAAGLGLTVLPCHLCDPDTRFARVGGPIPELEMDLWILTHPDLKSA